MIFTQTSLSGVWLIDLEPHVDERGFLVRTYCEREFADHGLNTEWPQSNLTLTRRRGMLRGLHYQAEPRPEIKLIRCNAGAVFDVVVDIQPDSPTFGRWAGFELNEKNQRSLYIPVGFAHGFQCLQDDCEVFYQMSDYYDPDLVRGIVWNDPRVGIKWPIAGPVLSERDSNLPGLD